MHGRHSCCARYSRYKRHRRPNQQRRPCGPRPRPHATCPARSIAVYLHNHASDKAISAPSLTSACGTRSQAHRRRDVGGSLSRAGRPHTLEAACLPRQVRSSLLSQRSRRVLLGRSVGGVAASRGSRSRRCPCKRKKGKDRALQRALHRSCRLAAHDGGRRGCLHRSCANVL